MQRFLFLLGSGLLLSPLAHAQFGLRAGGTLTHFTTKDSDPSIGQTVAATTDSKLGYQAGAYYQVKLGKYFAVVPEVQFSHENSGLHAFRSNVADAGYRGDYALSLNYINMPLLMRVKLGPVYVEAGPQISLLVSGSEKGTDIYNGWSGLVYQEVDQNITNRYRRFDVGPCVGVGVDLPAGFGVSVRGFQGLVSSTRTPDKNLAVFYTNYPGRMLHQTLQASLTYQLAAR
ncbi:porin family protein [Hymenobacter sp. BT559]|uniref:porin family protein n=1 Tax=Hymenobacter sp. BT559 TaxID=2795729 RepID=UPI0018EE40FD|nr:porin family protein [Hymenobacter sp. BT559]MBJ6144227.1 PorT family protein [Hymenobacter sp. BT559]